MIVEERTYTLHPGKIKEYIQRFGQDGFATYSASLKNIVGVFTSEVGTLNQVVIMTAYESFEDRLARREALYSDKDWQSYVASVRGSVHTQQNRILIPAPFSPLK